MNSSGAHERFRRTCRRRRHRLRVEQASLGLLLCVGSHYETLNDRPSSKVFQHIRNVFDGNTTVDDVIGVDHQIGSDVAQVDGAAGIDEYLGIQSSSNHFQAQSPNDISCSLLRAMRRGADDDMLASPVQSVLPYIECFDRASFTTLPYLIVDAETAARIGPLNILEFMADDSAGAALDAALVRKQDPAIVKRRVTRCRAAINTLLPFAKQTYLVVDDADVCAVSVDIVGVEAEFPLDRGRVEYSGPSPHVLLIDSTLFQRHE